VVERVRIDLGVVADRPRDARHLVRADTGELPLEQAVVVARPAGGVARREGLAHAPLVVEEPARADLVRDRMAVAAYRGVGVLELGELVESRFRPVLVREVAEGLLVAARVARRAAL